MADQSRLEDLRRRVQKDPASIAFAQLAEEYRRAGQSTEAIDICRAGLALHPGYLSARVTLGRALIEVGNLDEAQHELETVLKSASENLAAIRGLAEIFHKQGALPEALTQYQAALALAKNDPELEQTVSDLMQKLAPQKRQEPADALSFEQMRSELARRAPPPAPAGLKDPPYEEPATPAGLKDLPYEEPATPAVPQELGMRELGIRNQDLPREEHAETSPDKVRAVRTVEALEQWLAAIHAARTEQRA